LKPLRRPAIVGGMTAPPERRTVTAEMDLTLGGESYHLRVVVPEDPVPARALLPLARGISERAVAAGADAVVAQGKAISCRAGCGACCRQLVPVTASEAHQLALLVAALPEPRQDEVRARFAAARAALDRSGLLPSLEDPECIDPNYAQATRQAYFQLGIACPFLEEESCSIHPERPLICREFLVTSPAEHCADPTPEAVESVEAPVRVSQALGRLSMPGVELRAAWVPLVLALEWAASHPEPVRPGREQLEEFLRLLTGKPLAGAPGMSV
jgi:Fe-S-cluster containining protein